MLTHRYTSRARGAGWHLLRMAAALLCRQGFLLLLCCQAWAHDPFSGSVNATITETNQVAIEMRLSTLTVQGWVGGIFDRNNQVSQQNLYNIEGFLLQKAARFFTLRSGELPLELLSSSVKIVNHTDTAIFYLRFSAANPQLPLFIRSDFLAGENPEFKLTLAVNNAQGTRLALAIQSPQHSVSEVSIKPQRSGWGVFLQFVVEGVHHIFIGFDHLLFLFSLLIVCRSPRAALLVISCFTLAHSVTLALAALNIAVFPSAWVELFIALTIVYVGVENLYSRHQPKMRWALTALFGLVHGLGFANVLREMGLGDYGNSIALPLLAFNLGVEIGQVTLALIFLPLLWFCRKRPGFDAYVLPASSILVVVIGAYWVFSRLGAVMP